MTTPRLVNPVAGYIHPEGWPRPAGNREFRMTSSFAEHVASGRGPGIDFGDGGCEAPLYAVADGVVSLAGRIPNSTSLALVVRAVCPQFASMFGGKKVEWGAAHLHDIDPAIKVGQPVHAGQLIGHHGTTGATACHLHQGLKVYGSGGPGDEVDWWPWLWQNRTAWITTPGSNIRVNQGVKGTTSPGPLYAQAMQDGHIHRVSDHKDLGLSSSHRAIRQPVKGATYQVAGVNHDDWLPFYLDGTWRYLALPLATVSG